MKTFDIKKELYGLQDLMQAEYEVNEVTGEITDNSELLKQLAAEIQVELADKADAIIYTAKEFKASEDALNQEIKRLQERKKQMQNKQDQMKDLLDFLLGGEKLKTEKFTIFYGKSESLDIEDESVVPAEFIAFTPKIDRTALKRAVKAEEVELEGVSLKTKVGIRWR